MTVLRPRFACRRRAVVLALLLAAATSGAPGGRHGVAPADAREAPARPAHVVLVILGGGVRAQDMLDAERMPTVAAVGEAGRVVEDVRSGAAHAYDGAARILTGRADAVDGPARPPAAPTLMEYVRVGLDLPPEKVWFVSFEGGDALALAHSTSPEHGAGAAPRVASGMGAFGEPLAPFLESTGRPDPLPEAAWPLLRALRAQNREAVAAYLPRAGVAAGTARSERVERALLEELDRRALLVRGPNPRDERAWRAARTVLRVHRPTLLVLRLGEAEQAAASAATYHRVLAANDDGLARLRRTIAADEVLADQTLLAVVADMGRDAEPNARGGLDAQDGSDAHRRVAFVAEGPGLRRGRRLERPRAIEDVCPTLGRLLGIATPQATGRVWSRLLRDS